MTFDDDGDGDRVRATVDHEPTKGLYIVHCTLRKSQPRSLYGAKRELSSLSPTLLDPPRTHT